MSFIFAPSGMQGHSSSPLETDFSLYSQITILDSNRNSRQKILATNGKLNINAASSFDLSNDVVGSYEAPTCFVFRTEDRRFAKFLWDVCRPVLAEICRMTHLDKGNSIEMGKLLTGFAQDPEEIDNIRGDIINETTTITPLEGMKLYWDRTDAVITFTKQWFRERLDNIQYLMMEALENTRVTAYKRQIGYGLFSHDSSMHMHADWHMRARPTQFFSAGPRAIFYGQKHGYSEPRRESTTQAAYMYILAFAWWGFENNVEFDIEGKWLSKLGLSYEGKDKDLDFRALQPQPREDYDFVKIKDTPAYCGITLADPSLGFGNALEMTDKEYSAMAEYSIHDLVAHMTMVLIGDTGFGKTQVERIFDASDIENVVIHNIGRGFSKANRLAMDYRSIRNWHNLLTYWITYGIVSNRVKPPETLNIPLYRMGYNERAMLLKVERVNHGNESGFGSITNLHLPIPNNELKIGTEELVPLPCLVSERRLSVQDAAKYGNSYYNLLVSEDDSKGYITLPVVDGRIPANAIDWTQNIENRWRLHARCDSEIIETPLPMRTIITAVMPLEGVLLPRGDPKDEPGQETKDAEFRRKLMRFGMLANGTRSLSEGYIIDPGLAHLHARNVKVYMTTLGEPVMIKQGDSMVAGKPQRPSGTTGIGATTTISSSERSQDRQPGHIKEVEPSEHEHIPDTEAADKHAARQRDSNSKTTSQATDNIETKDVARDQ